MADFTDRYYEFPSLIYQYILDICSSLAFYEKVARVFQRRANIIRTQFYN